jgi:hypothetical protein
MLDRPDTFMPIPPLTADGLLPPGTHDCSLDEIKRTFGRFRDSDRRPRLTAKLAEYVGELTRADLADEVIVDGSYVTGIAEPNDIDLVIGLAKDFDFTTPLRPHEYNLTSGASVKRMFGLDIIVDRTDSSRYAHAIERFTEVRGQPGLVKGVLRLALRSL